MGSASSRGTPVHTEALKVQFTADLLMARKARDRNAAERVLEAFGGVEHGILEAFKVLDKDGNGYVSAAELRRVIPTNVPAAEVDAMLREADLEDRDGRLNYEEFVRFVDPEAWAGPGGPFRAQPYSAHDPFWDGQAGILKSYTFNYEAVTVYEQQKAFSDLGPCCLHPVTCWFPIFPAYLCYHFTCGKYNIRDAVHAQHVALTANGIRYVVDKHTGNCWGYPKGNDSSPCCGCDEVGRHSRTIPYDQISDCEVMEPGGVDGDCACVFPAERTFYTLYVGTTTEELKRNTGMGHAPISLMGIDAPYELKKDVLSMKRDQGIVEAEAARAPQPRHGFFKQAKTTPEPEPTGETWSQTKSVIKAVGNFDDGKQAPTDAKLEYEWGSSKLLQTLDLDKMTKNDLQSHLDARGLSVRISTKKAMRECLQADLEGERLQATGTVVEAAGAPPPLHDIVDALKRNLGLDGTWPEVVDAACLQLGVAPTGSLQEKADACWRAMEE